ncbi:nitrate- and nitrite sensing domain-containing protein [Streptomyces sp. NPDC097619]|uniref:sensor histidine kinase n=1 Tax=Streptomyces sp. NPDC097619 TaxID=3157228 RepID=UPI00331D2100
MGSPQAPQGLGDAAAEQGPRGGNDRGSSPQHAPDHGPAGGDSGAPGKARGKGKARTPKPGKGAKGKDGQTGKAAVSPLAPQSPLGDGSAISGPAPHPGSGSRLALQNWRISTRLVSLLALPVVAATSLGGFRINESLNEIQQLEHMQLLTTMTKQATALASALQEERDKSAGPLRNNPDKQNTLIKGIRDNTDQTATAFVDATQNIDEQDQNDETLQSIRSNVLQISQQLMTIEDIRKNAYKHGSQQTVSEYNQLILSLLSLSQDMAQATSSPEMIKRTRALAAFSAAKEYASIQRAVIAAALPESNTKPGALDENDRLYALAALKSEGQSRKTFDLVYQGKAEELTETLNDGHAEISSAEHYARRILGTQGQFAKEKNRSWMDWYDQDDVKIAAMKKIELSLLEDMEQEARYLKNEAQRDAIINGALILLVLGVSLVGAFVVARSMIRSLKRLQDTATRVAQDRLPELVKQLSESDPQDVDTSVESVGVHSRDEIGQVAAAFDDVHREAVRLAAEQALLRGNVNAMFTNLSRRSQGLIQRQLSLISELESREADPDQLSSLFKLDHLATRMRRNGENLLVLAGEEPGRRWTRPVPLVDVLRAAASEVEQYERIELASVPGTEVAGRVVNDLVHLLAELLENATSFSSPQTKVKVTGHALPDGRVLVEIHDTGIGLSPEDLAAINERLASPPTVDVSVSRRMGLFVVGRLSLRHGIRIQLRPSDSGGTTALVMLPVDVAQGGKKPGQAPGAPGSGQQGPGAQGGGRPAGAPQGGGAGRVAGGPQRPAMAGAGQQRGALPGRDGQRPPQGPGQGPQGQNAFGAGAPMAPRGPQGGPRPTGPGQPQPGQPGQPGAGFPQGNSFERPQAPAPQAPAPAPAPIRADAAGRPGENRPQLPPRGGERAELPGAGDRQPVAWGTGQAPHAPETPRGHDELQGPGSTAEFARPDFDGPPPAGVNSTTGQFERPDVRGPVDPAQTGRFERPGLPVDPSRTGQFARPGLEQQPHSGSTTGQFERPAFPAVQPPAEQRPGFAEPAAPARYEAPGFEAPRPGGPGVGGPGVGGFAPQGGAPYAPAPQQTGQFPAVPAPRAEAPQLPQAHQPEALPPAPGGQTDARTPLFDNLESNWYRPEAGPQGPAAPQQFQQPAPAYQPPQQTQPIPVAQPQQPLPQRGQERAADALTATGATPTVSWRSSPNDELMKQAERVRQPAAGGVTTSGLPRRVPRANLVAGTAQQQSDLQSGPQVSRAPDDVRGRLTNLRRGIQQGRQAGTNGPATGSFRTGPTHQQER